MMPRAVRLFILCACTFALAVAFSPAPSAAGESISARLLKVDTSYGQETWKYDVAYQGVFGPQQTLAHLQNSSSTYYGAVGARATFKIQIYDTQNPTRALKDTAYNLTASINTLKGPLYAFVKRGPGTTPGPSDSDLFWLDFDLDGSNNGDPLGRYPPALEPGQKTIRVDITKRQQDIPPSKPVGSADLVFTYEIPSAAVSIPAFNNLPYLQNLPDDSLRLFNDIGWGDSVLFVDRGVLPANPITITYQFSGPNLHVRLYGFLAERGVATPGGPVPASNPALPFIPGISDNKTLENQLAKSEALIIINQKMLGEATTAPDGQAAFRLTGEDLLKVRATAPAQALVVLAPSLDPRMPETPDPANYAGSANLHVGASELVVPVSDRRAVMERYTLLENSGGAQNLPDPVRQYGLAVNGLQVDVRDVDGFVTAPPQVRQGDLVAIIPDVRNSAPLSGTSLAPTQRDANLLRGTLSVRGIQEQGVSFYRILALLYRENDAFYGLTYGDRGYALSLAATSAPLNLPANLYLNLTSRNTNYDLLPGEPDFQIKVLVRVTAADFKYNQTTSYTLTEGGFLGLTFPFQSNRTGDVRVDVGSTSGDATPRDLRINLHYVEPKVKKTLADRLPGFDAVLLLAAAAAALVLVGLRRRRA